MPRSRPHTLIVIVAVGAALLAGGPSVTRARAQATGDAGDPDPSFHGRGWTIGPESEGGGEDLAVQADGKLVLTGRARAAPDGLRRLTVWRLHPDGSPDVSFNGTGAAFLALPQNEPSGGFRVAVAPDGRIVVAGFQGVDEPSGSGEITLAFVLVRFLPDGGLDASFGPEGQGFVREGAAGLQASLTTLAVQPDGKILTGVNDGFLRRRLPDGELDPSFGGGDGSVYLPQSGGFFVSALTVLGDDSILVTRSEPSLSVTRLLPDGTTDPGFGESGSFSFPQEEGFVFQRGARLTVNSDGKMLVCGSWTNRAQEPPLNGFAVMRLLPGGQPDVSFGSVATPGHTLLPLSGVGADKIEARAMAVQSDGGIFVAGASVRAGLMRAELAGFAADGLPDTAFGTGGRADIHFGGVAESIAGLTLMPGEKVFAAGLRQADAASPGGHMLLARFLTLPLLLSLNMEYPAGRFLRSGSSVDFGPVTAGTHLIEIALRNTGISTLTNLHAALSDESRPGDFRVAGPFVTILAPGESTSLTLSLTPSVAPGLRTAGLRLTAGNPGFEPLSVSLSGSKATPLQIWRVTWFGSPDNSGAGADENDFDHDGLPNFMEYAIAGHPHQPSPSPLLPVPGSSPPAFTCIRPSAALTEFSWQPESAPSPAGPWTSTGLTSTILTDDGTLQTVKISPAAETSAVPLFIRLRVTKL